MQPCLLCVKYSRKRLAAPISSSLQDQDCPGGCFSPSNAFDGDIAVLRIWNRVLSSDDIKRNMMRERPESESGLVGLYIFDNEGVKTATNGEPVALDRSGEHSMTRFIDQHASNGAML